MQKKERFWESQLKNNTMKITYNNPERCKERENVVPPTIEEMKDLIGVLNQHLFLLENQGIFMEDIEKLSKVYQRHIDHYSNLQHFYDVVGGWEGYEKLLRSNPNTSVVLDVVKESMERSQNMIEASQKPSKWISIDDKMPKPNLDLLLWDGFNRYRGYYRTEPFNGKTNFFMIWEGKYSEARNPITHWQLLPDPPQQ